ncbi:MAG: tetratricopeptide repeat protein [Cyanobacteria bacterium SBLK]|nr:tetratricopeptide repeat protein [Cyanobacteria bacterium SBLK]
MIPIALLTTASIASETVPRIIAEAEIPQNIPQWQILYDRASKLDDLRQYIEGEAIYRQILQEPRSTFPNDYMYYYVRLQFGHNLQAQGRLLEAIAIWETILENSTQDEINRLASNTLEKVRERLEESEQNINAGADRIQADPADVWGYRDFVRGLEVQKKLAEALNILETRLNRPLTSEEAIALARGAKDEFGYRATTEVLALYRAVARRFPNNESIQFAWLSLLEERGEPEEAIAIYREMIRENPANIRLKERLAHNLARADRQIEAIAIYEELIASASRNDNFSENESNATLYLTLGELLERTQQSDRALQIYLQAIRIFPEIYPSHPHCHVLRKTAYNRLVALLASQNRLNALVDLFEQLQPNPTVEMYFNLALVLKYQNYEEALAIFQRHIQERYPHIHFGETDEIWGRC